MQSGVALPVALTGADQLVFTGPTLYAGFTIRETAGAAAVVRIYDGTSAAGTLLETIGLAALGSDRALYVPGITAGKGIYVDIVSGTVEGSIRQG